MAGAPSPYGSMGSVPYDPSVAPSGPVNARISTQANPNDFGAQVGQGIEKVGESATGVANMYGGMIMETAANQAELGYIKASGDLKAKYSQYEGLQAEAMRPQYEADLQNLHQQVRAYLPLMAQKMFDSNTVRSLGYQTSEYASYAAGQVKSANLSSNEGLAAVSIAKAGNLPTVIDPQHFGELNGTIIHAENAIADLRGWSSLATGTDPHTGKLTFGDSPQAQATKAQYEEDLGKKQSNLYLTAAKTITDNHGAAAAAGWVKDHWNSMPDVAKVQMNQFLAPKVKNETISGSIASQSAQIDAGWQANQTANIPSSPTASLAVRNNNPGNLRDSSTGQFRIFDTPEAGAAAMQSDLTAKISGNSPAMEKNFGRGYSPTLSNVITTYAPASDNNNTKAYIDTVSKETGLLPDQALTLSDIPKLQAAMTKVESGGSGSNISQGQSFANKKDYLESQKESYVQNSVDSYLKQYPDDYYGAQITEKRATAEINKKISIEGGKLKSDTDIIEKAIGGSMTKGVVPTTVPDLQAIPGIKDVMDRVQREQGDFYKTIDTRLAKASHGELSQNSPNAYDAIQAALDNSGGHDRQSRIEYLSKGLGSDNPGYSISQKDFNDAKPAIDLEDSHPGSSQILAKHMKEIATANGNIDGKGQDRAIQWYNQVMAANKANDALGDKRDKHFWEKATDDHKPPAPGIMEQLKNWVTGKAKEPQVPTLTTKEQFDALPSGSLYIRDGQQYRKP